MNQEVVKNKKKNTQKKNNKKTKNKQTNKKTVTVTMGAVLEEGGGKTN
jgi:hypothetical protein